MADKKKNENSQSQALYEWLSHDLQKAKNELLSELKVSSTQIGYLYKGIKDTKDNSSSAMAQEIRYSYKQNQNIYDGLANLLKKDVAERLNSMDEKIAALDQIQVILNELSDLKYNYMQLQAIYESISSLVSGEVIPKLDAIADKDSMQGIVEEIVSTHSAEILEAVGNNENLASLIEETASTHSTEILNTIADTLATKEEVKALVEENAAVHSQQVLDAVAAIPTAENVDYARISEEVGDKLLELLNEIKSQEEPVKTAMDVQLDYDRVAGDTAAKVIECLPHPEGFDYNRLEKAIADAKPEALDIEALADVVAAKVVIPEVDEEAIATKVVGKIVMPEFDYDLLAEKVVAKMVTPEVDYEVLADLVIDKLAQKGISADVLLDEEGITKIADTVAEKVATEPVEVVDYDRVAGIVEEKLADELRNMTLVCEYVSEEEVAEEAPVEEAPVEEVAEAPVEEVVEEVVEEAPVEEVVEEPVEEVVEEVVEEAPVEEVAEETPVEEEIAVAADPVYEEDMDGQLIDAETGLVVRLKRSFTAKMKQSEEQVKVYYSDIKNALTSYKRINSNVSWHGDRFNFGRDTVAKIGINGKTLCFYLALDPNDPELKTTVYHQKDVGGQKAYENTPFMVKVKSDAALKKALRLVDILATKLSAERDEAFEATDYVSQFAYASTKRLFEEGDIKATKEKKVDFNF